MLTLKDVKKIVHQRGLSRLDQLLPLFAIDPSTPQSIKQIKDLCLKVGLRKLAKTNISDIFGRSKGFVVRTTLGWEIQSTGLDRVQELTQGLSVSLVVTNSSQSLRTQADLITDRLTKSFVMEAICCFEAKQYRAAVVFSWAGAIALLHKYIFTKKLNAFNEEAVRRNNRWRNVRQQDDLGRMKEYDFLNICEAIGVIGKNVKQILQNECLTLRNSCGHPNSVSIAEISVAAHIEKLIKNIFARF